MRYLFARSARLVLRDPVSVMPQLMIPIFLYLFNLGLLKNLIKFAGIRHYASYIAPSAVLLGVTGVTRAVMLARDIESGFIQRLLATNVRRRWIVLGPLAVDAIVAAVLSVLLLLMAIAAGARSHASVPDLVAFVLVSLVWSIGYSGFLYTVAFRFANGEAVRAFGLTVLPLTFMTTVWIPLAYMDRPIKTIAQLNPLTAILATMRSLLGVDNAGAPAGSVLPGILVGVAAALVGIGAAMLSFKFYIKRLAS